MNNSIFYIALILHIVIVGCEIENVDYPPEPFIEFKKLEVIDTVGTFNQPLRLSIIPFYLTDGDGDIGPINNCDFIKGNCFVELFYKNGNSFIKDTISLIDTIPCGGDSLIVDIAGWFTIPSVGDLGQDKALKADVYIENEFVTKLQISYKTFFYKITAFDMALNQSNTISTDTIFISQ